MPVPRLVAANDVPSETVIRILLLTDLVDSTRLVEKLGDARAYEVATRHDRVSRDLLPRFNGLEIDKTDGFLLLFQRPADAVGYALAYHQALAELSVELGAQLRARAGIHLGEVFLRENDPEDVARGAKPLEVDGLAKPTAARVMSLARGKQTLLTQSAFDMARQAAVSSETSGSELRWLAHGSYLFKGVEEPIEIFEVGEEGRAPLAPPADTAKVRRVVAAGDEVTLGWRPGPGLEIPRRSGWMLERRLGEGGFGEVWLAIQKSTDEPRVFKFCHDADQLRSLKREVTLFRLLRESLGNCREIVRILDWSFDEAPYYLEEELVGGGDLLEWAAQQGGLLDVPLETRLEILAQVADALAAAHSVGILHRDVKPQNVLIAADRDGSPRAKLADFGISQVVDEQALLAKGITVMGLTEVVTSGGSSSVTGSHLYMAPEVAEGRTASVQADIYALGVMLYQLVAGDFRRALGSGWQRDIGDELLAADIASFVDRAPERRPGSTREVAERLRTLEERRREIEAERQALEKAEAARLALERAQRRRKILAAISVAAVVVLAVVSVLAVQAIRARGVAEQRRGQAEDLIGFMLGDLRGKLEPVGRLEILDDVGEKALEYFAAVPEAELSDEELLSRSRALYQIGDVQIARGNLGAALVPLGESLELAQTLVERDPDHGDRLFELGQSHFWVGFVHWRRDNLEAALEQFKAYQDVSERLVDLAPDNLDWQLEVAYAHSNIGFVLRDRGDLEGALERYETCLTIEKGVLDRDPANTDLELELASIHNAIGKVLETKGDLEGALEHHQTELAIKESLRSKDPENATWLHYLAVSHNYVGSILMARGEPQIGLRHFRTALSIFTDLRARDPTHVTWQRELARTHYKVGEALHARGELDEAVEQIHTTVGIMREVAAEDPTDSRWQLDLAGGQLLLGDVLEARGNLEGATLAGETALEIASKLSQQNPDNREALRVRSLSHILLGRIWARQNETRKAKAAWTQAADTIERIARDSDDKRFIAPWAIALLHLDRIEDARPIVERLHAIGYRDRGYLVLSATKGL